MNKKGRAFWYLLSLLLVCIVLVLVLGTLYNFWKKGTGPLESVVEGFKGAKELFFGGGLGEIFGERKDEFTDEEVRQAIGDKCAKELEEIVPEGEDRNLLQIFEGEKELCTQLILCAEEDFKDEEYEDSIYNLDVLLRYCREDSRTSEEKLYTLLLNSNFDKVEEAHRVRYNFGELYLDKVMFERARGVFKKVVKWDGGLATEAQFQIGESYYYERDYEKAKEEYGKVEELEKAEKRIYELNPTWSGPSHARVSFESPPSLNIYEESDYRMKVLIHDRDADLIVLKILDGNERVVFNGVDDYRALKEAGYVTIGGYAPKSVNFLWYEYPKFLRKYTRKSTDLVGREKDWIREEGKELESGKYYYELIWIKGERGKEGYVESRKTGTFELIGATKETQEKDEGKAKRILNTIIKSYQTCIENKGDNCVCDYDGGLVQEEFKKVFGKYSIKFVRTNDGTKVQLVHEGKVIEPEKFLEGISPCYHYFRLGFYSYKSKEVNAIELKLVDGVLNLFNDDKIKGNELKVLYKYSNKKVCFAPIGFKDGFFSRPKCSVTEEVPEKEKVIAIKSLDSFIESYQNCAGKDDSDCKCEYDLGGVEEGLLDTPFSVKLLQGKAQLFYGETIVDAKSLDITPCYYSWDRGEIQEEGSITIVAGEKDLHIYDSRNIEIEDTSSKVLYKFSSGQVCFAPCPFDGCGIYRLHKRECGEVIEPEKEEKVEFASCSDYTSDYLTNCMCGVKNCILRYCGFGNECRTRDTPQETIEECALPRCSDYDGVCEYDGNRDYIILGDFEDCRQCYVSQCGNYGGVCVKKMAGVTTPPKEELWVKSNYKCVDPLYQCWIPICS